MEEESEGWLRSGCAEGERKGVEGGKSVRALPRGRVRREFFARRLGTMGEPVERGVEGGGGVKGGERRATAFAGREGKAGRMGRREERGRRKVAVDGESKAENPKGNHSTRDIVGRVVEVSTSAGKENQSLSLSAVGFFSGVSLRDFSEGKLKGNGRKLFLLASDFWHVSGRGMFFLGNLGGRV